MQGRITEYVHMLTEVDRYIVSQVIHGPAVVKFSVQYEALIRSRWRKIIRYDNSHGYAHKHLYYPNDVEYKQTMNTTDYNQSFTEAQQIIKKDFMTMRENYIIMLERMEARYEWSVYKEEY